MSFQNSTVFKRERWKNISGEVSETSGPVVKRQMTDIKRTVDRQTDRPDNDVNFDIDRVKVIFIDILYFLPSLVLYF